MFNRGYMKEIQIADGTLTIEGTFNVLKLDTKERELVFALVDMIDAFADHPSVEGRKVDRLSVDEP